MFPQQEPSSTTKLVQEVVQRNNEAVVLMEHGDFVSAATILEVTAAVMQSHHDCFELYSEEDEDFVMDVNVPADSLSRLSRRLPRSFQGAREHSPIELFDRAFFLDYVEMCEHGFTFEVRQFCLIILFYNMALCMHVQAFSAHTRQDEFFTQAEMLYQMACGLHEYSSDARLLMLLSLALTNNLASIHAHFCDVPETNRWLDEVRFTYAYNAKRLRKEEWSLFSSNLIVNEEILGRAASAA